MPDDMRFARLLGRAFLQIHAEQARTEGIRAYIGRNWKRGKQQQRACGALTRAGTPCQARALPGKRRCRFHGGLSTGPRTAEGRAAIAESNRRRAGTDPA